ncbi:MAG TPA: hypothetical protein PKO41_06450 [Dokdonella sp.]|uniref:hypothetical protein n=1 Tax=Dokdonella sp. TaxID=2291710 RepID=UPI0025B8D461|nr:hypothetical protein [Dokdonella sp.]MBX3693468.1 hypothetical protein [Dokdonella sp.]MCW5568534.1 hypothetical protein [Dokdonella sp.]HNR92048.1 hypothetical protein [Dokdonella sp.]
MISRRIHFYLFVFCLTLPLHVFAANPFVEWKERLFGSRDGKPEVRDAPDEGVVMLGVDHPKRLRIDGGAPERDFPQGRSRYREIELPGEYAHVAMRVQVIARANGKGRGNTVYKPVLYLLNDDGSVRDSRPAEPLHLDIRPFKPTRLLSCVLLEDVRRIAVATTPAAVGKSYESKARDKLKAPSKANFHYSTDAVNVRLPFADTGELILELTVEDAPDQGC